MNNMTWKETIKLGKNVVCTKLNCYELVYDHATNYLKLCSQLYKHEQSITQEDSLRTKGIAKRTEGVAKRMGVTRETVIAQKEWTSDQMRDYRQRYLGMRNYIQDWFDRANNGELTVNAGVFINAQKIWNHYRSLDRYSGIKKVYNYLYRFDNDNTVIDRVRVRKHSNLKSLYGGFFR